MEKIAARTTFDMAHIYGVLMSLMLTNDKSGNFSLRRSESSAHSTVSIIYLYFVELLVMGYVL